MTVSTSMVHTRRPGRARAVAAVLLAVVAACGGGDVGGGRSASSTPTDVATSVAAGDVVFGNGEIPDGFPDDFPVPESATVGSTFADPVNKRYEVILFLPAEQDAATVYYETNLPSLGYTITAGGFEGADYRIEFERNTLIGRMLIRIEDTGITIAAIDLTSE